MEEANIQRTVRRTKRTLHLVVGMYVAIGLVVSGAGALTGDRVAAFLGFVIVGGALGAAAMLSVLFSTVARMGTLDKSVGDLRTSLARIEELLEKNQSSRRDENAEQIRVLNLASVGGGDLDAITAATLDRSVFPRLMTAMGSEQGAASSSARSDGEIAEPRSDPLASEESLRQTTSRVEVAGKDLWLSWKTAMRNGDLATCRSVYAALVDFAETDTVADMAASLDALALRHERRSRRRFTECVQAKQFSEALAMGAEIGTLFPNHPLSDEFERLRPLLERRASSPGQDQNIHFAAST